MRAKRTLRDEARELRKQGMSVRDIADTLGVSTSSASLWVRDIELSAEQKAALKTNQRRWGGQNAGAQVNRGKARDMRIVYQEDGRQKAREGSQLHLIGCMLYWAEGAKARNGIYFANSDSQMLTLFVRFLREELNVAASQIKLLIHCHSDNPTEIQRIERYWLNLFDLPTTALSKTQVKKGSDTRRNILENGVCSVRVYNTELAQHIFGAIQEYGGFENPDWLF